MKILFSVFITLFIFGLLSCQKEEGPGGTSTIKGKVWMQDYTSDFEILKSEFWAEEVEVYLIYGDDLIYSDRTKTNYDGSYWFQYLHEGNYTVFVYSEDSSEVNRSLSGKIPVKEHITISKSKSDIQVPQITILGDGPKDNSTIAGKVWVQDYTSDFAVLKSEYWAEEEDVYLIHGNDSIFSDKTSTNWDGSYWFQSLHEGNYTIYVYSRDKSTINPSASGRIPVKAQVSINNSESDVIVPTITIIK